MDKTEIMDPEISHGKNRTFSPLKNSSRWTCPYLGLPTGVTECAYCLCPALQMQQHIRVSIIVPCKEINALVEQCVHSCLALEYQDFEILLLPDELPDGVKFPKTRIIPTGKVKPSVKRNLAVEMATGKICAFLDSDAYPAPDWLNQAVSWFGTDHIDCVGGPNITPAHQPLLKEVGGDVLSSILCSGPFALRYKRARTESFQTELPTCNLLIRKSVFSRLQGFEVTLLTAEDSKLCFEINETGHKVLYSPDVIVYHHRRALFIPHLKQISSYANDKAKLVKQKFTWDKLIYTVPSIFVLGLILGPILSAAFPALLPLFVGMLGLYVGLIVISYLVEIRKPSLLRLVLFAVAIPMTHFVYGISFIFSLTTRAGAHSVEKANESVP